MKLAYPRCRYQMPTQLQAESTWLACSACHFEFTRSDFEIQAKRDKQVAAWPHDPADANNTKNRIEALLKSDVGFKDYTQIIQQNDTLYSVSATSNYTFLSHQPRLMDLARTYLTKQAEPQR